MLLKSTPGGHQLFTRKCKITQRKFERVKAQILISNGDGTFRDETETRFPSDYMNALKDIYLHDLDRDGHQDIFTIDKIDEGCDFVLIADSHFY